MYHVIILLGLDMQYISCYHIIGVRYIQYISCYHIIGARYIQYISCYIAETRYTVCIMLSLLRAIDIQYVSSYYIVRARYTIYIIFSFCTPQFQCLVRLPNNYFRCIITLKV